MVDRVQQRVAAAVVLEKTPRVYRHVCKHVYRHVSLPFKTLSELGQRTRLDTRQRTSLHMGSTWPRMPGHVSARTWGPMV